MSRRNNVNRDEFLNGAAQTVAPIEVGHRSISVGLLGEIAMLTAAKLRWDPSNERFLNSDQANRMLQRPMRGPWRL